MYDKFGEEGLKAGGAEAGGQFPSGFSGFPGANGAGFSSFRFTPRNAEDIFTQFFGSRGMGGKGFNFNMDGEDSEDFGGFTGFNNMGGSGFSNEPRKAPPVKRELPCSLEELYNGATKKMKITKTLIDASGKEMKAEKVISVEVKKGWKVGTKITFPEEGDEKPGVIPGDIIFVIEEKSHNRFVRQGDNLVYTARLTLAQALTGHTIEILTLDNRTIRVPITEIVYNGYQKLVPNEGMPNQKTLTKGDLYIKFDVIFPRSLTEQQKAQLKSTLSAVSY